MPMEWDFKCLHPDCGSLVFTVPTRDPTACPRGHGDGYLARIYAPPAVHQEMQAQFSPALGKVLLNKRHYHDELKRASEAASEDTGMEHRYVPIDMADRDATRRTEE